MKDIFGLIATRSRPRVFNTAARIGAQDYSRQRHLPRLLKCDSLPRSGEAIMRLLDLEADMDERRRAKAPDYRQTRHLELMIAILGEAQLLRG